MPQSESDTTTVARRVANIRHPLWVRSGTTDEICLREIFDQREYQFTFVTPPQVIVDAGANAGYASVFFAHRYPNAKVFAIEPESTNFTLLQRNAEPYENIIPIRAALWASVCPVRVVDPGKGKWGFRTEAATDAAGRVGSVRGLTIGQLIAEYQLSRIDLLKLDIEGAEKEVLENCAPWIHLVDAIIVELHDRFKSGCRAAFDTATQLAFPKQWRQRENICVARAGVVSDTDANVATNGESETERARLPIIATMLCANNQSIIPAAIRTVIDWVDHLLLIDTGITDDSLKIARELAGDKLWVETFAWCNDFARARNFALEVAASRGAAWALTIDTDERVEIVGVDGPAALRTQLASEPGVRAWLVSARDGSYSKERFIRVPTSLDWRGRTHEALCGATVEQRKILLGVTFWEEVKTPEQFRAKLERDLQVLREETSEKPENARWWYYLGQTLDQLGEYREAADAYRECVQLKTGWAEEAAWAAYCGARCLVRLGHLEEAIDMCARGLARQPASPELAWQAGYCSYQLGRNRDAIAWEEMAIAVGHVEGSKAAQHRISFRHLPGWYEGPYDVLRHSYKRLGDDKRAGEFERKYHNAIKVRESLAINRVVSQDETTKSELLLATLQRHHVANADVKRVAVLGLYSSGSTATAGILYHLGATMGKQFWANYYEPKWLSAQLRLWWDEPRIREMVAPAERIRLLKLWMRDMSSDAPDVVAAKHPLLTLCGKDLRQAWGEDTKFIWTCRPLQESIASLARRGWWPEHYEELQRTLWEAANTFFADQNHLRVEFADLLASPEREVDRIIRFTLAEVTEEQRQLAIASVKRES